MSAKLVIGANGFLGSHVVDELLVHGRPEDCRERVEQYRASGLDTPVVMVVPTPGVDEATAVRQLAPGGGS